MKRENIIEAIACIIDTAEQDEIPYAAALRILSYIEDIGMLPPPCIVTIKDNKHTPTERRWDDETE